MSTRNRTPVTVRRDLEYATKTYGHHPAFHRMHRKNGIGDALPVIYIYDSYHNKAFEWRQLLGETGTRPGKTVRGGDPSLSIRGSPADCFVLFLMVEQSHSEYARNGFDGFYTYFAADGFTYGSSSRNWPALRRLASATGTVFVPSVGPGYVDTSVRPWNGATTRDRRGTQYYDTMWKKALAPVSDKKDVGIEVVSITSFNEWHEGTQIEPAVPERRRNQGKQYRNYGGDGPLAFLKRTKDWSKRLAEVNSERASRDSPRVITKEGYIK